MAIRNTLIGGEDFRFGEQLKSIDLKDTFDKIASLVDAGNS
jgi:hypothetical protein